MNTLNLFGLDLNEAARKLKFTIRDKLAGLRIKRTGNELTETAIITMKRTVAPTHTVTAAVACDILDNHIFDGTVNRLGGNRKSERPFGIAGQCVVIMLKIITFQDAVHQVGVLDIRDSDHTPVNARKRVAFNDSVV